MTNIGVAGARIAVAILLIQVSLFAAELIARPRLDSDASVGLLVWQSMERGSPWNCALQPDPADISVDRPEFLTWWSPGQYLVVGPLHRIGLSWGVAIAFATLSCVLAGVAGYWRLYLALGFEKSTAAWSAGILSLTPHVCRFYGEFPGGELPVFAVSGWLLAAVFAMKPLRWLNLPAFAAIFVAGAMVKLSFCITAAAGLAGVCLSEIRSAPGIRRLADLGAKSVGMVGVGYALTWFLFLRHGTNPSQGGGSPLPWWYVVPFVTAAPIGSILGFGGFVSRVFLFPGHEWVESAQSLAPLFWVLGAATIALCWTSSRSKGLPPEYGSRAAGMVLAYVFLLGALILHGAAISLEERQLFPAGAVIVPVLVSLAGSVSSPARRGALRAILGASCAYGLVGAVVHARQNLLTDNVGRAGITQHMLSRAALAALHALDDAAGSDNAGTAVYVPSPEIALELEHARAISTLAFFAPLTELRAQVRHGRVPLLVMLSDPELEGSHRGEVIRDSFADYPRASWQQRVVGGWTFFYQGPWPSANNWR
jgi:hypothetical protein